MTLTDSYYPAHASRPVRIHGASDQPRRVHELPPDEEITGLDIWDNDERPALEQWREWFRIAHRASDEVIHPPTGERRMNITDAVTAVVENKCSWCGERWSLVGPDDAGCWECANRTACAERMDVHEHVALAHLRELQREHVALAPLIHPDLKLCPDPILGTREGWEWCPACCACPWRLTPGWCGAQRRRESR